VSTTNETRDVGGDGRHSRLKLERREQIGRRFRRGGVTGRRSCSQALGQAAHLVRVRVRVRVGVRVRVRVRVRVSSGRARTAASLPRSSGLSAISAIARTPSRWMPGSSGLRVRI